MSELVSLALALWIVTHTIATEIPLTAKAPKPLSCQLCLSGWLSITAGVVSWVAWDQGGRGLIVALALWALTAITEAFYQRLKTFVL